jgi:ribonuclease Y
MSYVILGSVSVAVGYGLFFLLLKLLPRRLKADHGQQYNDIIEDAKLQAKTRLKTEAERNEVEFQLRLEQLESDISERQEDLKLAEEDIVNQEHSFQIEESRVQKFAKDVEQLKGRVESSSAQYQENIVQIANMKAELSKQLEIQSNTDGNALKNHIHQSMIDHAQIEQQKVLRFLDEELSSSQKRLADRLMTRVMARYAPKFYWPKSINTVEIIDRKIADQLLSEGQAMIDDLKSKAEIEVEIIQAPELEFPSIKLSGGAGINREAARLALNELLLKGHAYWSKAGASYDKKRAHLEQEAVRLGRQAVQDVGLLGVHPEIQKLVGYLNWRTSYRQNQWYHTVEVAKLAGIIAHELGIDPDAAKRCGLLHDIGKALDYRIEGSHAVISGDYADRFGEKRLICDTVMSHHNDLIVETPLAYVLKAADTLSGARPGARVNLEEGYQMRLSGIDSAVRSFPGVMSVAIMNGAREVHVEVNNKKIQERELEVLSANIAKKIEADVAYPGEIKILVTRRFEATAVA